MAFADILRSAQFTGGDIADLIEGLFDDSHPLTWTTWSPTYSANGTMTYTSVSTTYAKYIQVGKLVPFVILTSGTVGGSLNYELRFTPPVTISGQIVIGSGYAADGGIALGAYAIYQGSSLVGVRKYDASNWTSGSSRGFGIYGVLQAV